MRKTISWKKLLLGLSLAGLTILLASAQTNTAELKERRNRAINAVPDGLALLHSRSGLKHWDEAGFHQDPNFFYFSGLVNLQGAILVLDGQKRETWLFLAPQRTNAGT